MLHTANPTGYTRQPFLLIPWENDAIKTLLTHCLSASEHGTKFGDVAIMFMHDRPRRYMLDAIRSSKEIAKPCLLPTFISFQECVSLLRQHLASSQNTALKQVNSLDQIALLGRCVRNISIQDTSKSLAKLPTMDDAAFFPWGHYLAELMETCFTQAITPSDIYHAEYDVAPFAAALLETLGDIFADYTKNLEDNHLTTPAYDAFCVANLLKDSFNDSTYIPAALRHKQFFIVANYALSGAEEIICQYFWEHGARICLHTDPALADPAKTSGVHYTATSHKQWIQRWQTDIHLAAEPQKRTTKLHFFTGHDLHSQLAILKEDLQTQSTTPKPNDSAQADDAIILTHAGCLMPLLHTIPQKDCNLSLGYPLEHSLVMQLITTLLDARTTRRNDNTMSCAILLNWCRHPYIRALITKDGIDLHELIQATEEKLMEGKPYIHAHELLEHILQNTLFSKAAKELYTHAFTTMFIKWGESTNTFMLGTALSELCDILITQGATWWHHFPLDAECLYRLTNNIITLLKTSDMAYTDLPWHLLQSILINLIQQERVPFEADPLKGLQVLGMLETRFLRFRRVFILDLTDDKIPGNPNRNPLLPDSLRAVLGLPDTHLRDHVAAYTFTRLLKGADEAFLYWQESTQTSALFDGKKQRSRFIEERIWEAEQKTGTLFTTGQNPLRTAPFTIKPTQSHAHAISKTPALKTILRDNLRSHTLSATALNTYITCPAQFFYDRLCKIKTQTSIVEGHDPMGTGQLIHAVLHDLLTPYLKTSLSSEDINITIIHATLNKHLAISPLRHTLSPENLAMLHVTIPRRLEKALQQLAEPSHIKHLEYTVTSILPHVSLPIRFRGTLDRVDHRSQGIHILDYKTGKDLATDTSIWQDIDFWNTLKEGCNILEAYAQNNEIPPLDTINDPLPLLRKRIPNIQLHLYAALYNAKHEGTVYDVAKVDLHDSGKEFSLFPFDMPTGERKQYIRDYLPLLFDFCTKHMESLPYFIPNQGIHCDWCSVRKSCILSCL